MFVRIGVRIAWHALEACPVEVDAIQRCWLSRGSTSVRNVSFEALAATQPYAWTVTVFLDRVKELNRNLGISVMAVVLAHEITHVLEGINRHSVTATGIMKARWDNHDNLEIGRQTLAFAQDDIELILRPAEDIARHRYGSCRSVKCSVSLRRSPGGVCDAGTVQPYRRAVLPGTRT